MAENNERNISGKIVTAVFIVLWCVIVIAGVLVGKYYLDTSLEAIKQDNENKFYTLSKQIEDLNGSVVELNNEIELLNEGTALLNAETGNLNEKISTVNDDIGVIGNNVAVIDIALLGSGETQEEISEKLNKLNQQLKELQKSIMILKEAPDVEE